MLEQQPPLLCEQNEQLPGGYLGSMQDSLRLLPRFYQVLCICSVASLFWFDTAIVVNLLNHFHISFGTNFVWAEDYTALLGSLYLHERVALALFALGLIALVAAIYSLCAAASSYSLTPLQHFLFPSRDQLNTFLWIVFSADTFVAILVTVIPACTVAGISQALDPKEKAGAPSTTGIHVALQIEILKRIGLWWVQRALLPGSCAVVYRFIVDSGRPGTASRAKPLRRYMSSVAWWRLLLRLLELPLQSTMAPNGIFELQVEIVSAVVIQLVLNHECGASDPAGDIKGLSRKRHALHSLTALLYCCSVPAVAALCLVAGLVGVHVVELIAVWMMFTIVTLWIPAAFDSFALDYIASMIAVGCIALTYYQIVPASTACRMWVVWFVAAAAVATVINFASNLLRSRKVCLAMVLIFAAVVLYLQEQKLAFTARVASAIVEMDTRALVFSAESLDDFTNSVFSLTSSGTEFFSPNISFVINTLAAALVTLLFSGFNELLAHQRVSRSRQGMASRRKRRLPLVTLDVLCVKLSQVFVFAMFVVVSVLATLILRHFALPLFLSILPHELHWVVAAVFGFTAFGALMDSREDCLVHVLRSLGFLNPPPLDNGETEADSPLGH